MNRRGWLGLPLALPASEALAQLGGRKRLESRKSAAESQVNHLEVTLHEFHEDLKLTPAQEPAWEAYAQRLRALASDVERERSRGARLQMNLLERLDRTVDLARNQLTAVEDIALTARSLYALLNEDQQRIADPRLANIISLPGSPLTGRACY